jgi:hypothetical protein
MVNGTIIGDPLDIKMFEFTNWALEEGSIGGTGVIKSKGAPIEQTALVQNVVRPPGSMQFRVEDALKGSAKVRLSAYQWLLLNLSSLHIFWSWALFAPLNLPLRYVG